MKIYSIPIVLCFIISISPVSSQSEGSCVGRCGQGYVRADPCHCDYNCMSFMECCHDYRKVCTTEGSCKGRCYEGFIRGQTCDCDPSCERLGRCCPDYEDSCPKPTKKPADKVPEDITEDRIQKDEAEPEKDKKVPLDKKDPSKATPKVVQPSKKTTKRSPRRPRKKTTYLSTEDDEEQDPSQNSPTSSLSSPKKTRKRSPRRPAKKRYRKQMHLEDDDEDPYEGNAPSRRHKKFPPKKDKKNVRYSTSKYPRKKKKKIFVDYEDEDEDPNNRRPSPKNKKRLSKKQPKYPKKKKQIESEEEIEESEENVSSSSFSSSSSSSSVKGSKTTKKHSRKNQKKNTDDPDNPDKDPGEPTPNDKDRKPKKPKGTGDEPEDPEGRPKEPTPNDKDKNPKKPKGTGEEPEDPEGRPKEPTPNDKDKNPKKPKGTGDEPEDPEGRPKEPTPNDKDKNPKKPKGTGDEPEDPNRRPKEPTSDDKDKNPKKPKGTGDEPEDPAGRPKEPTPNDKDKNPKKPKGTGDDAEDPEGRPKEPKQRDPEDDGKPRKPKTPKEKEGADPDDVGKRPKEANQRDREDDGKPRKPKTLKEKEGDKPENVGKPPKEPNKRDPEDDGKPRKPKTPKEKEGDDPEDVGKRPKEPNQRNPGDDGKPRKPKTPKEKEGDDPDDVGKRPKGKKKPKDSSTLEVEENIEEHTDSNDNNDENASQFNQRTTRKRSPLKKKPRKPGDDSDEPNQRDPGDDGKPRKPKTPKEREGDDPDDVGKPPKDPSRKPSPSDRRKKKPNFKNPNKKRVKPTDEDDNEPTENGKGKNPKKKPNPKGISKTKKKVDSEEERQETVESEFSSSSQSSSSHSRSKSSTRRLKGKNKKNITDKKKKFPEEPEDPLMPPKRKKEPFSTPVPTFNYEGSGDDGSGMDFLPTTTSPTTLMVNSTTTASQTTMKTNQTTETVKPSKSPTQKPNVTSDKMETSTPKILPTTKEPVKTTTVMNASTQSPTATDKTTGKSTSTDAPLQQSKSIKHTTAINDLEAPIIVMHNTVAGNINNKTSVPSQDDGSTVKRLEIDVIGKDVTSFVNPLRLMEMVTTETTDGKNGIESPLNPGITPIKSNSLSTYETSQYPISKYKSAKSTVRRSTVVERTDNIVSEKGSTKDIKTTMEDMRTFAEMTRPRVNQLLISLETTSPSIKTLDNEHFLSTTVLEEIRRTEHFQTLAETQAIQEGSRDLPPATIDATAANSHGFKSTTEYATTRLLISASASNINRFNDESSPAHSRVTKDISTESSWTGSKDRIITTEINANNILSTLVTTQPSEDPKTETDKNTHREEKISTSDTLDTVGIFPTEQPTIPEAQVVTEKPNASQSIGEILDDTIKSMNTAAGITAPSIVTESKSLSKTTAEKISTSASSEQSSSTTAVTHLPTERGLQSTLETLREKQTSVDATSMQTTSTQSTGQTVATHTTKGTATDIVKSIGPTEPKTRSDMVILKNTRLSRSVNQASNLSQPISMTTESKPLTEVITYPVGTLPTDTMKVIESTKRTQTLLTPMTGILKATSLASASQVPNRDDVKMTTYSTKLTTEPQNKETTNKNPNPTSINNVDTTTKKTITSSNMAIVTSSAKAEKSTAPSHSSPLPMEISTPNEEVSKSTQGTRTHSPIITRSKDVTASPDVNPTRTIYKATDKQESTPLTGAANTEQLTTQNKSPQPTNLEVREGTKSTVENTTPTKTTKALSKTTEIDSITDLQFTVKGTNENPTTSMLSTIVERWVSTVGSKESFSVGKTDPTQSTDTVPSKTTVRDLSTRAETTEIGKGTTATSSDSSHEPSLITTATTNTNNIHSMTTESKTLTEAETNPMGTLPTDLTKAVESTERTSTETLLTPSVTDTLKNTLSTTASKVPDKNEVKMTTFSTALSTETQTRQTTNKIPSPTSINNADPTTEETMTRSNTAIITSSVEAENSPAPSHSSPLPMELSTFVTPMEEANENTQGTSTHSSIPTRSEDVTASPDVKPSSTIYKITDIQESTPLTHTANTEKLSTQNNSPLPTSVEVMEVTKSTVENTTPTKTTEDLSKATEVDNITDLQFTVKGTNENPTTSMLSTVPEGRLSTAKSKESFSVGRTDPTHTSEDNIITSNTAQTMSLQTRDITSQQTTEGIQSTDTVPSKTTVIDLSTTAETTETGKGTTSTSSNSSHEPSLMTTATTNTNSIHSMTTESKSLTESGTNPIGTLPTDLTKAVESTERTSTETLLTPSVTDTLKITVSSSASEVPDRDEVKMTTDSTELSTKPQTGETTHKFPSPTGINNADPTTEKTMTSSNMAIISSSAEAEKSTAHSSPLPMELSTIVTPMEEANKNTQGTSTNSPILTRSEDVTASPDVKPTGTLYKTTDIQESTPLTGTANAEKLSTQNNSPLPTSVEVMEGTQSTVENTTPTKTTEDLSKATEVDNITDLQFTIKGTNENPTTSMLSTIPEGRLSTTESKESFSAGRTDPTYTSVDNILTSNTAQTITLQTRDITNQQTTEGIQSTDTVPSKTTVIDLSTTAETTETGKGTTSTSSDSSHEPSLMTTATTNTNSIHSMTTESKSLTESGTNPIGTLPTDLTKAVESTERTSTETLLTPSVTDTLKNTVSSSASEVPDRDEVKMTTYSTELSNETQTGQTTNKIPSPTSINNADPTTEETMTRSNTAIVTSSAEAEKSSATSHSSPLPMELSTFVTPMVEGNENTQGTSTNSPILTRSEDVTASPDVKPTGTVYKTTDIQESTPLTGTANAEKLSTQNNSPLPTSVEVMEGTQSTVENTTPTKTTEDLSKATEVDNITDLQFTIKGTNENPTTSMLSTIPEGQLSTAESKESFSVGRTDPTHTSEDNIITSNTAQTITLQTRDITNQQTTEYIQSTDTVPSKTTVIDLSTTAETTETGKGTTSTSSNSSHEPSLITTATTNTNNIHSMTTESKSLTESGTNAIGTLPTDLTKAVESTVRTSTETLLAPSVTDTLKNTVSSSASEVPDRDEVKMTTYSTELSSEPQTGQTTSKIPSPTSINNEDSRTEETMTSSNMAIATSSVEAEKSSAPSLSSSHPMELSTFVTPMEEGNENTQGTGTHSSIPTKSEDVTASPDVKPTGTVYKTTDIQESTPLTGTSNTEQPTTQNNSPIPTSVEAMEGTKSTEENTTPTKTIEDLSKTTEVDNITDLQFTLKATNENPTTSMLSTVAKGRLSTAESKESFSAGKTDPTYTSEDNIITSNTAQTMSLQTGDITNQQTTEGIQSTDTVPSKTTVIDLSTTAETTETGRGSTATSSDSSHEPSLITTATTNTNNIHSMTTESKSLTESGTNYVGTLPTDLTNAIQPTDKTSTEALLTPSATDTLKYTVSSSASEVPDRDEVKMTTTTYSTELSTETQTGQTTNKIPSPTSINNEDPTTEETMTRSNTAIVTSSAEAEKSPAPSHSSPLPMELSTLVTPMEEANENTQGTGTHSSIPTKSEDVTASPDVKPTGTIYKTTDIQESTPLTGTANAEKLSTQNNSPLPTSVEVMEGTQSTVENTTPTKTTEDLSKATEVDNITDLQFTIKGTNENPTTSMLSTIPEGRLSTAESKESFSVGRTDPTHTSEDNILTSNTAQTITLQTRDITNQQTTEGIQSTDTVPSKTTVIDLSTTAETTETGKGTTSTSSDSSHEPSLITTATTNTNSIHSMTVVSDIFTVLGSKTTNDGNTERIYETSQMSKDQTPPVTMETKSLAGTTMQSPLVSDTTVDHHDGSTPFTLLSNDLKTHPLSTVSTEEGKTDNPTISPNTDYDNSKDPSETGKITVPDDRVTFGVTTLAMLSSTDRSNEITSINVEEQPSVTQVVELHETTSTKLPSSNEIIQTVTNRNGIMFTENVGLIEISTVTEPNKTNVPYQTTHDAAVENTQTVDFSSVKTLITSIRPTDDQLTTTTDSMKFRTLTTTIADLVTKTEEPKTTIHTIVSREPTVTTEGSNGFTSALDKTSRVDQSNSVTGNADEILITIHKAKPLTTQSSQADTVTYSTSTLVDMVKSTVATTNKDTPTSTSFKLLDKHYTTAESSKAKTLSIMDTTSDDGLQTGKTNTENEQVTMESTGVFPATIQDHLLSTLLDVDTSRIKTTHGLTTFHSIVSPTFSPLSHTTSKIYLSEGSSTSSQDLAGSTDQNFQTNAISASIIEAHVTDTKHTNKIVTSTPYINLHEPSFNFTASTLKTTQDQSTTDSSGITHTTVSGKLQETTNTLPDKSEPVDPTKQTLSITDNGKYVISKQVTGTWHTTNAPSEFTDYLLDQSTGYFMANTNIMPFSTTATTQNSEKAQTKETITNSDIMKTTESSTRHSDLTISSKIPTKEPSTEPHQTPTSDQSFKPTTEQPKDESEVSTIMSTGKQRPTPTNSVVFETTKDTDKDDTEMSTKSMHPTKTPDPRDFSTKSPMEPEKMENIRTTKLPTANRHPVCDLLKDEAIKLKISGDDLQRIIEICTEMQQYYPLVSTPSPDIKQPNTDDRDIPSGYSPVITPNWNRQPGIRIIQIVEEIYRRMTGSPMTNLTSVYGYTIHKPSVWLLLLNKIRSTYDPQMNLCIGQPADGMTTLQNGSMVTFRGHYYWMLNRGGVMGSPQRITDVWGIPSPIDTVFTRCNCGGKTFFIKGSRYWRFTNDVMDQGYPKEIIKGFGGLSGKITAVLPVAGYRRRPESVYFFKPSILHEQRTISSTWRGIPNNIISAVSLPNYEKKDGFDYYVFNKDKYYNINMSSKVAVKPSPGSEQKTTKDWYKCKE